MRDSEVLGDVLHGANGARMDTVLHVIVVALAEEVPSHGVVRYLHGDKPGQGELGVCRDIDDAEAVARELNEDGLLAVAPQRIPVGSRGCASAKH